jgi:hypothetical protein
VVDRAVQEFGGIDILVNKRCSVLGNSLFFGLPAFVVLGIRTPR